MFRYEPAARRELDAAMDFYDQQRIGLGDEFLDEVERAIALLTENAKLGRGLPENHRFFLLFRFPKRRPDYWRGRVEEPKPGYVVLQRAA